jgi:predicted house-cleaning noncanonical NTP pyrophosphatase (MazG superfamily)
MEDKTSAEQQTLVKVEEVNQAILADLVKNVEEFLKNKKDDQIALLAECIKKIFYSRVKIFNKNVSHSRVHFIRFSRAGNYAQ